MYNLLKNNLVGVFTFGFGVSSLYSFIGNFLSNNIIFLSTKDIILFIISMISSYLSFHFLNNEFSVKQKLFETFSFTLNLLGFITLFVPLIALFNHFIFNDKLIFINIFLMITISFIIIYIQKTFHEHIKKI